MDVVWPHLHQLIVTSVASVPTTTCAEGVGHAYSICAIVRLSECTLHEEGGATSGKCIVMGLGF
eukprot:4322466-Amphidinium_carterae.1